MLDLYEQLRQLVDAFERNGVDYALCGGLAMAVYGLPRSTIDIDVLLRPEQVLAAKKAAAALGYVLPASPMTFSGGKVKIERVSKIDPEAKDVLTLDMLLVTPACADVWESKMLAEWEHGKIWVVSREGLVKLKSMRSSGQDLDDIKRLTT